ncbi:PREDICTED: Retrovirus-related Pol poly from transposon, partial [Prunus dulcis]
MPLSSEAGTGSRLPINLVESNNLTKRNSLAELNIIDPELEDSDPPFSTIPSHVPLNTPKISLSDPSASQNIVEIVKKLHVRAKKEIPHDRFSLEGKKLCKLKMGESNECGVGGLTKELNMEDSSKCLASEFEMKDLGALKHFLGVEVTRSPTSICLSLRKFVLDMLTEIGMLGYAPAKTPIVQNHYFAINLDQVPIKKERYQRLVR